MSTLPSAPQPSGSPPAPETTPLDLLIVIGRHKGLVSRITLAAAVLSVVASLLWPKTFTATTRILPPQQGQSTAAALLGQLGGGLAGLAGGALGVRNPAELYVGMLKSDTVADALIERFKLREAFGEDYLVDARKKLAKRSRFVAEAKSGIITIEVDARTPGLAADLTNAYVEQLHRLTGTLAVTEAGQRRLFFERQLQQTKEKLAEAEVKLRQAIEQGGLVSVDAQGRAAVETVARLRAQISAKEIQIGSMKGYAAPGNPDLQRAERELASMRQELARLEGIPGGEAANAVPGDAKGVANIRLMREVKYQEVMFELLAKQYELARVDEAKEAPVIQALDRATPPEKKSGPKRALIVILSTMTGFLAGLLAALARNALESARQDPARQGRLEALRAAWLRRRA